MELPGSHNRYGDRSGLLGLLGFSSVMMSPGLCACWARDRLELAYYNKQAKILAQLNKNSNEHLS